MNKTKLIVHERFSGNDSSLAQMWTATMWWLCAVDSVLPILDMIYLGGALVLGAATINSYSSTTITVSNTTRTSRRQIVRQKKKKK